MTDAFDTQMLLRLPLADAGFRLLDFVTDDAYLEGVFSRHRGRSYEKVIGFPLFVHLIADSLLGHRGSAHQTFEQARREGRLESSRQAMYGKLARVPLALSRGFFAETTERLGHVLVPAAVSAPAGLEGYRLLAFDGKKLKHVSKRLKLLRGLAGSVVGGKLLVVQDLDTNQAVAFEAVADGEAADNPLVPGAVAQVRALADPRPRLWVADAAFCDYRTPPLLAEGADHFVVRHNARCPFVPDPGRPARRGPDRHGVPYVEDWGFLGRPGNPRRMAVRRITLERRDDEPLVIVTDLSDERVPASDLLDLYRRRWGIETLFLQATNTFGLRELIGGTPEATVFQAAFCLLLSNILLAIGGHVAASARRPPSAISLKLFFDELVRQMSALLTTLSPEELLGQTRRLRISDPEDLAEWLRERLDGCWRPQWQKSPTRPRPPKKPPRAYLKGGHSSVKKILAGEHEEIPFGTRRHPAAKNNDRPAQSS